MSDSGARCPKYFRLGPQGDQVCKHGGHLVGPPPALTHQIAALLSLFRGSASTFGPKRDHQALGVSSGRAGVEDDVLGDGDPDKYFLPCFSLSWRPSFPLFFPSDLMSWVLLIKSDHSLQKSQSMSQFASGAPGGVFVSNCS